MATPNRKLVMDNIATTLAGITTGGGYKTTVTTVERVIKEWESVGATQMPWVGFMSKLESFEYQPGSLLRVVLPITIAAHVNVTTGSAKAAALSDLQDDIIAALHVDQTRGGNAVMTSVISCQTDEGDPDSNDSRGGSGTMVLETEVVYFRTSSAS